MAGPGPPHGPAPNRPLCWAAACVALLSVPVPLVRPALRRVPGQWHTGPLTPGLDAVRAFATVGCALAALYIIVQLLRSDGHVRHALCALMVLCSVALLRDALLFGQWSPPTTFQDRRWALGCRIALLILPLPATAAGLSTYAWLQARSGPAPATPERPATCSGASRPNRPFYAAMVALVVLAALEPIFSLALDPSEWIRTSMDARMALAVIAELAAVCSVGVAANVAVRLARPNTRLLASLWVLAALEWLCVLGQVGTFVSAMPWSGFGSPTVRDLLGDYAMLCGLGFLVPIAAVGMATAAALMEWRRLREDSPPPELAGATEA